MKQETNELFDFIFDERFQLFDRISLHNYFKLTERDKHFLNLLTVKGKDLTFYVVRLLPEV